jgi:circadian clock protein KaiC
MQQITLLFTSLTHGTETEETDVGVSSLIDTWMLVRQLELSGERNRGLYVLKSRGMAHSNQVREMVLSERGIELTEVYVGPEGALTGAARLAQEAKERAETVARSQEIERARRDLERRRQALDARMTALRLEFEAEEEEMRRFIEQGEMGEERRLADREDMARARQAQTPAANGKRRRPPRGD